MAAVASLQAELKSLCSSSRRHNQELSKVSSKSLSILEAAGQSFDNDQAIIASLMKYEDFPTPFILACSEASAKSCASALQCIQTLATYKGIATSRLQELLRALMEATQLGLGIQLKILQVLPVILFEFASELDSSQVFDLLHVCIELLGSNKVAMVHNAGYATLQQLITGVFDRTELDDTDNVEELKSIAIDAAETITLPVRPRIYDAAIIWIEICTIAEGQPAKVLKIHELPLTFTLELLELTLLNQSTLIHKHDEFVMILRVRIIPLLLRLFSEETDFSIVLRVVRVFYLLLRQHWDALATEAEVILSTLAQGSLMDLLWKRVLCLEVLQGVLLNATLFFEIYEMFDGTEGRINIIDTITTNFASSLLEKDGLILATDLNQESYDQAVGKVNPDNKSPADPGVQFLVLTKHLASSTAVIEMLDRSEPPQLKKGHAYYLIMKCINSLADDIHKFASVQNPTAPAVLRLLRTSILKCFSVVLGVAMDLDLFRQVVRAVQKMAHASGIASETTARDEFLMLLSQCCILQEGNAAKPLMLGRCSLCVRALFNLGYALGNQLEESWALITGAIFSLKKKIDSTHEITIDCLFGNDSPEYRNMNAALRKLIESTSHHSDLALVHFINAIQMGKDPIKYRILEQIVILNVSRFGNSTSDCWSVLAEALMEGIRNTQTVESVLKILNHCSLVVIHDSCAKELDNNTESVHKSLGMVICTLCRTIRVLNSILKIMEMDQLKSMIEKYGSSIKYGWEDILSIVSETPSADDPALMQSAFKTLELICSDFLENLPYPCIFNLTICLNEFSRQEKDLNTSFTSTSLFWSVCDHLMANFDATASIDAQTIISESDLVAVARDYGSEQKRIALWLFAIGKLASITETACQQQVRMSALQIFFRLFNTHVNVLPDGAWDIAFKLILPSLLNHSNFSTAGFQSQDSEFMILLVNGISRFLLLYLSKCEGNTYFEEFWIKWIDYLCEAASITASITMAINFDLKEILGSTNKDSFPIKFVADYWAKQKSLPNYAAKFPKQTADSLEQLVGLYSHVAAYCDEISALEKLTNCALFPYYTVRASSSDVSSLQLASIKAIENINFGAQEALRASEIRYLTSICTAPFNIESLMEQPQEKKQQQQPPLKPDFDGLSRWAQDQLSKSIEDIINEFEIIPEAILDGIDNVFKGMNMISRSEKYLLPATKISLQLLEICPNFKKLDENDVVNCLQAIFNGANKLGSAPVTSYFSDTDIINVTHKFFSILQTKPFSSESWDRVLTCLLRQSVIYERSVHNIKYYDSPLTDSEGTLKSGIVETPRFLRSERVSYTCISLLRQLATREGCFQSKATSLFVHRARAVLCQYVGDCKILGREPLRLVLRNELKEVLQELDNCKEESWLLEQGFRNLILETMSSAHREFLPMLRRILTTNAQRVEIL